MDLKDAQRQLQDYPNRIFPGVFSDGIGVDLNSDGLIDSDGKRASNWRIHFSGNSLNDLAIAWKGAIDDNNPTNSVAPTNLVKLETVTGGGNSYTLSVTSQGAGSTYYWARNDEGIYSTNTTSNGNNTFQFTSVSAGDILTCYIMKPDGRLAASQPFIVPGGSYDQQSLNASNSSIVFNSNVETKETTILAQNVDWDVISVPNWVSVGVDDENSKLLITTQQNPNSYLRQDNILIQQIGGGVSKNIEVKQNAYALSDIPLTTLTPTSSYTGAGTINYNGLNVSGNTMKVNGQTYTQGIGTHSQSGIVYILPSGYTHFNGLVGRDDGSDNCGCGSTQMNFQIKLNGNVVWSSMSHGENSNAESFSVPLNGATQLELFTDYQDGSYYGDWGDWINPVLSGSGGGSTGSPAPPHTVSANPTTVAPNGTSQLYATCAQGVVTWSNNATGSPISVNPSVTTTYNVNCVDGSAYSTSEAVTVNVTGGGGSCSVVSNNLVMGTWTVTGDQLVSRYLNGSYWLVQKVNVNGSQYDEFVVRGSEMLTRGDVALTNSSYSGLVSCYSWQYSNYGGLEVPNATSSPAFPVPSGFYGYTASDGTEYYSTYVAPSNSCSALSNNLVMGTWNVTGHQLVSRNFHNDYWLVQKVNVNGSQYDEFVVRGSAMLTRTDVTLNNSNYYNLPDCYGWIYSNYGNLEGPSIATFPTPSGYYRFVSNGTTYFTNYANGYNEGARMGVLEEREVSEELTPFLSFTPNPNTGKFEVILFLNEASDIQVSLTNSLGSQVLFKELNGNKGYNQLEIELKNKTPGVYIIKAVSDGKQDTKKVMIN